jgi:hypothetical protein
MNTRREIPYLQATMYYFAFFYKHTKNDVFDDFHYQPRAHGGRTGIIVLYQTSLILRFKFDNFNNFGSFWAAFGIKH